MVRGAWCVVRMRALVEKERTSTSRRRPTERLQGLTFGQLRLMTDNEEEERGENSRVINEAWIIAGNKHKRKERERLYYSPRLELSN